MTTLGTLILDEMVLSVTHISMDKEAFQLSGRLNATRSIARGELLTGLRVHGVDGSLITSIPDAVFTMTETLNVGDTLQLTIDVHMDNQTSEWAGQT